MLSAVCSCMQAKQPWYTSPALTGFLDPWCLTSMPLHSYSAHACKTSTICLTQSSPTILRCNLAPLDHSAATCGTSPLNPGKHFLIRLFFCGVPWRPCFLRHSPVKWICMNLPRSSHWLGSCLLCCSWAASKVSRLMVLMSLTSSGLIFNLNWVHVSFSSKLHTSVCSLRQGHVVLQHTTHFARHYGPLFSLTVNLGSVVSNHHTTTWILCCPEIPFAKQMMHCF